MIESPRRKETKYSYTHKSKPRIEESADPSRGLESSAGVRVPLSRLDFLWNVQGRGGEGGESHNLAFRFSCITGEPPLGELGVEYVRPWYLRK